MNSNEYDLLLTWAINAKPSSGDVSLAKGYDDRGELTNHLVEKTFGGNVNNILDRLVEYARENWESFSASRTTFEILLEKRWGFDAERLNTLNEVINAIAMERLNLSSGPAAPPEAFLCLISGELMTHPVLAEDGYVYDSASLAHPRTSPKDRQTQIGIITIADIQLQEEIDEYREASQKNRAWKETFNRLQCPITLEFMKDPVMAGDGRVYERTAIEQAIDSNGKSPITRNPLSKNMLFPHKAMKKEIENYLEQHPLERSSSFRTSIQPLAVPPNYNYGLEYNQRRLNMIPPPHPQPLPPSSAGTNYSSPSFTSFTSQVWGYFSSYEI